MAWTRQRCELAPWKQRRIAFDEAGVGVGYDEAHTAESAVAQAGKVLAPERLVLGVADIEVEYLTVAVCTQAGGDHDRFGHDMTVLSDMDVGGVRPDVHERLRSNRRVRHTVKSASIPGVRDASVRGVGHAAVWHAISWRSP